MVSVGIGTVAVSGAVEGLREGFGSTGWRRSVVVGVAVLTIQIGRASARVGGGDDNLSGSGLRRRRAVSDGRCAGGRRVTALVFGLLLLALLLFFVLALSLLLFLLVLLSLLPGLSVLLGARCVFIDGLGFVRGALAASRRIQAKLGVGC